MSITLPSPHDVAAGVLLTAEDWARSRDRGRVHRARGGVLYGHRRRLWRGFLPAVHRGHVCDGGVGLAWFHLGPAVAAGLGVALVAVTLSGGRYWRWERIVLALPRGSLSTLLLIASTVGATVTPWMVFFQQGASADKGLTHRDTRHGRLDTVLGGRCACS